MADVNTPIQVNPNQLPGIAGTILRGGLIYAVAKGILPDWIDPDQVVSTLLAVLTLVYASYRTYKNKAHLVTAAEAAPNSVAVVK